MQVKPVSLLKGAATFIPQLRRYACGGTGGTVSARYCYGVWMRHMVKAHEGGFPTRGLRRVAELGPGDSLGIGLAAMLTGVDEYFAFDAKAHAHSEVNERIFEELVELFEARTPIPDGSEFPKTHPALPSYDYPEQVLPAQTLRESLHPDRLDAIRHALRSASGRAGDIAIAYAAPWDDTARIEPDSIDMVFSQAVLEHVENIDSTYSCLHAWLREGALMSHSIDYKSHGLTKDWNGHWTVSDLGWKIVRGNRPYLINRHPHSAHVASMRQAGFQIVATAARKAPALQRTELAPRFSLLTDEDLETSGAFVQAIKVNQP